MFQWVLVLMIAIRDQYGEHAPKWVDSYDATASAIARHCESSPLVGQDSAHCAAILVDMAWHESRFDPMARGDITESATGKVPHSFGLFQMQPGTLGHSIAEDPDGQAEDAIRLLNTSFRVCEARKPLERLAWYMSGGASCDRALGMSRSRLGEVERLLRQHPFPR